jgi:hypothetical protein
MMILIVVDMRCGCGLKTVFTDYSTNRLPGQLMPTTGAKFVAAFDGLTTFGAETAVAGRNRRGCRHYRCRAACFFALALWLARFTLLAQSGNRRFQIIGIIQVIQIEVWPMAG